MTGKRPRDTPRLAYADWCEENGVRWHAELIRLQCGGASDAKIRGFLVRWRKKVDAVREMREAFLIRDAFSFCIGNHDRAHPVPSNRLAYVERGFVSRVSGTLADYFEWRDDIFATHPVRGYYVWDKQPTLRRNPPTLNYDWSQPSLYGFYREGELTEYGVPPSPYCTLPAEVYDALPEPPTGVRAAYPDGFQAHFALSRACVKLGRKRRDELWAK